MRKAIQALVGCQLLFLPLAAHGLDITLPTGQVKVVPTDDIAIVAWVNGSLITPNPSGVNPTLISKLTGATTSCLALTGLWTIGVRSEITSDADRVYANAFLVKNSANQPPSGWVNLDDLQGAGDYRLFNRLKATYRISGGQVSAPPKYTQPNTVAFVGKTPNPCLGWRPFGIGSLAGEVHVANGSKGITTTSHNKVYQVNEGRLGAFGQSVNTTLNDPGGVVGENTAWIWSVVKLDASGNYSFDTTAGTQEDHQMFPTYYLYQNGSLRQIVVQGDLETFISLDDTSQISGSVP